MSKRNLLRLGLPTIILTYSSPAGHISGGCALPCIPNLLLNLRVREPTGVVGMVGAAMLCVLEYVFFVSHIQIVSWAANLH